MHYVAWGHCRLMIESLMKLVSNDRFITVTRYRQKCRLSSMRHARMSLCLNHQAKSLARLIERDSGKKAREVSLDPDRA